MSVPVEDDSSEPEQYDRFVNAVRYAAEIEELNSNGCLQIMQFFDSYFDLPWGTDDDSRSSAFSQMLRLLYSTENKELFKFLLRSLLSSERSRGTKEDFIIFLQWIYEYPHLNEATANEFRDIVRETARELLGEEVSIRVLTRATDWYRQFSR